MSSSERGMTIGQFAAASMLSVKALRLYDERGLLSPATVDPTNGYRYYTEQQAVTGRLIALLRAAGMGLDGIQKVLESDSPRLAIDLIDGYGTSIGKALNTQNVLLAQARNHYTEEPMNDVKLATQFDQAVLTQLVYPEMSQLDDEIKASLDELTSLANDRGLTLEGDPFGVFHGRIDEDHHGPLEVCLPVGGLTGPAGDIRSYRMQGSTTANVTVTGADTDFPAILSAYDQAYEWVSRNGFTPAGPPRELWQAMPWATDNPVMTVCVPYLA